MELHRSSGSGRRGLGFALTTMVLWAVLPFALKGALRGLDAATITWFRFALSAGVLAPVLARRGSLPRLRALPAAGWLLLALATGFLAANYFCFLVGLELTTSANAQVLIQLAHVLLALGAITVFRERFRGVQWLGMAVLFGGLGLFFAARLRGLAADGPRYLHGSLWIVAAAVTWAIYGLAQKQLLRWLPSQGIMVCIYAGCALLFLPAAAPARILHLDPLVLGLLAFCGLNTVVAYGTFAEALVHWDASRVSAVFALTPLGTLSFAALGHVFLPDVVAAEPLTRTSAAGALAVVCGSLLVSLGARSPAQGRETEETTPRTLEEAV